MVTNNRVLLRFLILFVFFYTFPFPVDLLPKSEIITDPIRRFYLIIIQFLADHILHLDIAISNAPNGSGDKTYDYLFLLIITVIAVCGAIVWRVLDTKNVDQKKINYWLITLSRYYLGYSMLTYGIAKILPVQFGEVTISRLLQQYGDSSPMGLAWTFFAYSDGYKIFAGVAESLGGLLLFHKRTQLLGALICVAVISNIVAINFFYDVPVKLYSSVLLLMSFIIVTPNIRRLLNFFFFNKAIEIQTYYSPFQARRWVSLAIFIKVLVLLIIFYKSITRSWDAYNARSVKPAFHGMYEIKEFVQNGKIVPSLITDEKRWRNISNEPRTFFQVEFMDKSSVWFRKKIDTTNQIITLTERNDSTLSYELNYIMMDSTFNLNGVFRGDTISCVTKRIDEKDFLLKSRGFNWINETPYNR